MLIKDKNARYRTCTGALRKEGTSTVYGARISPYVLSVTVHFSQHSGIRSDSSPGVTKESGSVLNWNWVPNE
ncbi:unnamed protein product [Lasius platythorax]|uniref:Uncharacterized protein n=1 Tax=Lasius platythorax TaxID=488582 RepID=A0AAV2NUQ5_9HYME